MCGTGRINMKICRNIGIPNNLIHVVTNHLQAWSSILTYFRRKRKENLRAQKLFIIEYIPCT
ncbi:hypothetical protein Hanom_Chr16g01440171 [Helianthus anomalus]